MFTDAHQELETVEYEAQDEAEDIVKEIPTEDTVVEDEDLIDEDEDDEDEYEDEDDEVEDTSSDDINE